MSPVLTITVDVSPHPEEADPEIVARSLLADLDDRLGSFVGSLVSAEWAEPPKPKIPAGWGLPMNARKYHYFVGGSIESLCRRWWYRGQRGGTPGLDEACSSCAKARSKMAEGRES